MLGRLMLGRPVLGRLMLGGADRLARCGRRGGQVRDRGRRAGQHRDRAKAAGGGGEAAAPADLTAPRHDLGHVYRVAEVTGRLERLAQRCGV
jgi:hypothetical protein